MKHTKDISISKLDQWADQWSGKIVRTQLSTKEEDRVIVNEFIRFVEKHRND